jgi:hypothetical protein
MIRKAIISTAVVVMALVSVAARPGVGVQISAADAAPYLGDWTLTMEGPNGPGVFNLSIKVEKDTVVAEIGSDATPTSKISTISKTEKALLLSYSFQYESMTVDAVVTLTPGAEGKTAAQIDFAGGAYTMTGSATKKEKPGAF